MTLYALISMRNLGNINVSGKVFQVYTIKSAEIAEEINKRRE